MKRKSMIDFDMGVPADTIPDNALRQILLYVYNRDAAYHVCRRWRAMVVNINRSVTRLIKLDESLTKTEFTNFWSGVDRSAGLYSAIYRNIEYKLMIRHEMGGLLNYVTFEFDYGNGLLYQFEFVDARLKRVYIHLYLGIEDVECDSLGNMGVIYASSLRPHLTHPHFNADNIIKHMATKYKEVVEPLTGIKCVFFE
jgi:hypothetical protein